MSFKERLGKELLIFDGAMGTILQKNGLVAGELPELWNFKNEELILGIHKQYIEAGADIITTNTFGANSLKLDGSGYSVDAVVKKACSLAKKAADEADKKVYVALDMGPTGKLLEPYGDLPFEKAYELYKEQILAGKDCGVDFVLLETMGDLYEIKAAVLAVKENCELPIVVSMIFNEKGQLLTGADIKTAVFTLEGLGVDGIGLNCGLGPKQMKEIHFPAPDCQSQRGTARMCKRCDKLQRSARRILGRYGRYCTHGRFRCRRLLRHRSRTHKGDCPKVQKHRRLSR